MTFNKQQMDRRRRKPLLFAAAAATASMALTVCCSSEPAAAFLHHDGAATRAVAPHQRSIVPSTLPRNGVLLFSTSTSSNNSISRSRSRRLSTDDTSKKNGDDISQPNETQQPPVGSPLRRICDEESEFKMAVGKAIDTLRKDYPDILERSPDFSIYDQNIEVVDPSGVTLHGVKGYKTSFNFMHALVKFFYCPKDSGLTFRLMYDTLRNSIRVSWNAVLVPRAIYGGDRNLLHVDGISVYDFDRTTGQIVKHHIEHLLLNGEPQRPQEGVFSAIRNQAVSDGVPVFTVLDPNGGLSAGTGTGIHVGGRGSSAHDPFTVEFNTGMGTIQNLLSPPSDAMRTSLFSASKASGGDADAANGMDAEDFDEAAFNKKNVSRKKYGLPPMSVAEFQELQAQVRQMEVDQKAKAAQMAAAAAQLAESKKEKKSVLSSLFGSILQDTCESNYDCERPEVCCDLGVKKMCCSSGMHVFNGMSPAKERQLIRVPMPSGEEGQMPRGGPGGMNDGPYSGY
mmetsp:Transcript_28127/g.81313  ORF Transcript_28127/g.81313 Transcript_28127/m.81313 type:complete len:510 (-) Transcript_28127:153-1682(-)|eukprot:CAMPEP_0181054892 /NCGR_PEP_ID=MMETSP1070-20121207/18920_1 /TAXON_ID=265543 /ORGANISM="Minutocellus polymorphus, Strain NH13" /LENGTH=509 /DNA_ID=CAMNT_0023134191 /DNA_START=13 /DNA_END=1542 /DNA_ORIENTATION=-